MSADHPALELRSDLAAAWAGRDPFEAALGQIGTVYRDQDQRRTLRFEAAGRAYFLKVHRGVGWCEIAKNLVRGRVPILGAATELRAVRTLERLGIATLTVAGFGSKGANPARRVSFLVTDALDGCPSLEDVARDWHVCRPAPKDRHALIKAVAAIVAALHAGGVQHRDLYLCHFLLRAAADKPRLVVIDLHRARCYRSLPQSARAKDLGALWSSALDRGLGRVDLLRFFACYVGARGAALRVAIAREAGMLAAARCRARRIHKRERARSGVQTL